MCLAGFRSDDLRSKRNLWVSLLFKSERKGEGEIGGLLLMEKGTLVSTENFGNLPLEVLVETHYLTNHFPLSSSGGISQPGEWTCHTFTTNKNNL